MTPYEKFSALVVAAQRSHDWNDGAMSLSTVSARGYPSSRMVLLKAFSEHEGFQFFTNYNSRKATELVANPHASLLFYWPTLEVQVRVEGSVSKTSRAASASYFKSRPRLSQLGAWASKQSQTLETREDLIDALRQLEEKFKDRVDLPLPDFWGGFRVIPERFEFWKGESGRLHHRERFERQDNGSWTRTLLYP